MFKFLQGLFVRPLNGKAAILCFHRILPDSQVDIIPNPNFIGLCYSEKNFEDFLFLVTNAFKVVSLDNLIGHIFSNSDEFQISITFDDGYRDNYIYALPILEKYNVPATIYVTYNFLEKDTLIWWFEIWEILKSNVIIEFEFKEKYYSFDLDDHSKKSKAFFRIKTLFLSIPVSEHIELLKSINNSFSFKSYKNLFLTQIELRKLARHPLITIGAHTLNHDNLKNLSLDQLYNDYLLSKKKLERTIQSPVVHFAYPYGNSSEANFREYNTLREVGYETGVTLRSLFVSGIDKMSLVRIPITYDYRFDDLLSAIKLSRVRKVYYSQLVLFVFDFIIKSIVKRINKF